MFICESCGKTITDDSRYCWECGAPVKPGCRQRVKIRFDLGSGVYPTLIRGANGSGGSAGSWKPARLNEAFLKDFMQQQIDGWLRQGWELVITKDHTHLFDLETEPETSPGASGERIHYKSGEFQLQLTTSVPPESIPLANPYVQKASELDPLDFPAPEKTTRGSISPLAAVMVFIVVVFAALTVASMANLTP